MRGHTRVLAPKMEGRDAFRPGTANGTAADREHQASQVLASKREGRDGLQPETANGTAADREHQTSQAAVGIEPVQVWQVPM